MLKMAQIEYIKHLYEIEGKSLTYISKTMGLNFRTVKKYATTENWTPNHKVSKEERYPVLGPFLEIIDRWLLDDSKRPRKQRHTATRIHSRLVEEHEFTGSRRAVSDYVKKRKLELATNNEGYLPIEHLPGEAQLDFGEMEYIDHLDKQKKGHFLTLSFPHSNAAFTQVFEAQNQECVMEGLKRFFRFLNGVPRVIIMDNLKPVVSKILRYGEREITEGFQRFALHYRFQMRFCNPSSGNEKGNVENKIGYHRRNWFVPMPKIDDLNAFNEGLWDKAMKDMNRSHYKKDVRISALWQQDKESLLYLPEHPYDAFRSEVAKVNSYGCIVVNENSYTVSPEMAGQMVSLKIYYDQIQIYKDHQHLMTYNRSYGKKEDIFDWRQYLSLLSKRPNALEHTKFYGQIPKVWREHLIRVKKSERKTALLLLKELVDKDDLENGTAALELASLYGKADTESIKQCYYSLTHETQNPTPLKLESSVPTLNYNPKLSSYDQLTKKGVV